MKVRIIPGDFGKYLTKGGSWDHKTPTEGTFEVELQALPVKGSAILYATPDGKELLANVQEVVVSETYVYVFVPSSVEV